jgi:O-antigen/teichoic acid export membrane protein
MLQGLKTAAIWSLAQTLVRLACSFASIKVTAVYLGPAGLALTAQLGNFISLLQATLGNGPNTAMVNLSAQAREEDPERASAVVGTALRVVTGMGLLASLLLLLLHRPVAQWLLGDEGQWPTVVLLALLFPGVLLGQMYLSLFSAQRRFQFVSGANILATVVGAVVFVGLCAAYGLQGGLIGTVVAYPLVFLAGLWLGRREAPTRLLAHWKSARPGLAREVFSFYPMLLVHSIAMPLALLLVRDTMMSRFGAGDAGLWQSAVRLSDMYTMVVITTLSMYSLPTLSAARGAQEFRALLLRLVGACLGLALVAGAVLFAARELIVHIVFTPQFAPVAQLWPWQLLGDVFLLAGWPMRSALTAQRRTWAYMAVEAGIGLGLVGVTTLLAARMGPVAGNMAHAAVWSTVFVVLALLHLPTWRCRVRVKETR